MSDLALSNCTPAFFNNPDISGVGVRVSFYLQTFLLVLLVDRSWQDAPGTLWTFIATSFGLTIAAIVSAGAKQLTLFQALQVSNLVWLANFGTFVALASYSRQKAANHRDNSKNRGSDYNVKFAAMFQTLLSMALTLYMWSTAGTFGIDSACSPLVYYVLFVIKTPALGSGRIVGLVVSVLLTIVYISITLHELRSSYHSHCKKKQKEERDGGLPSTNPSPMFPFSTLPPASPIHPRSVPSALIIPTSPLVPRSNYPESPTFSTSIFPMAHIATPHHHHRRPMRRRWSSDLDPMLVGIVICQAMVFTYFIVSTELLLLYNPVADNSAKQWGFGQILALIVVIPSALSVADALTEHGLKRRSKRKRSHTTQHRKPREKPSLSPSPLIPIEFV